MIRLPVVYKGLQLMPMKASRVRLFISSNRAKIMFDRKLNLRYLKLLIAPSGINIQEITLGIDPGSVYDGFSLVSKLYHHINIELIQRPKKGKNSIRSFKIRQAMNRRIRRSRLRHRQIRFSNRNASKLPPTIRANIDFRKWLITKLSKYYPFTIIRIEDVAFNHYLDLVGKKRLSGKARGAYFSLVELGKHILYNWTKHSGYILETITGYETATLRKSYCDGVDIKSVDKSEKSFEAHCLDSFIIASKNYAMDMININKNTIFLEKIIKQRRCLTRIRAKYKDAWKYFRYTKGGTKVYFKNISRKKNICRVKPDGEHSNHSKSWIYLNNGFSEKIKSNTARYGGTSLNDCNKFFKENQWLNRKITIK